MRKVFIGMPDACKFRQYVNAGVSIMGMDIDVMVFKFDLDRLNIDDGNGFLSFAKNAIEGYLDSGIGGACGSHVLCWDFNEHIDDPSFTRYDSIISARDSDMVETFGLDDDLSGLCSSIVKEWKLNHTV